MGNIILSIAFSTHLGMAGEFNNIHPRATFVTEQNYMLGGFYNSESQPSVFVGKVYNLESITLETGLVSGYSEAKVVPMIKANYNNFFASPGYANNTAGLVLGYEVKF